MEIVPDFSTGEGKKKQVFYFARHGIREDWVNPKWKETATSLEDSPLAEEGLKQAKELAEALKNADITHIFASPYVRTIQTATFVAEIFDLNIKLENGIIEYLERINLNPLDTLTLAKMFPRVDPNYVSKFPVPKGENKKLLHERGRETMEYLSKEWSGNILIVTHAAPLIALTRGLLVDEKVFVKSGTCCIGKVVQNHQGVWIQELNGSTEHLSGGDQYGWEFPDDKREREENERKKKTANE